MSKAKTSGNGADHAEHDAAEKVELKPLRPDRCFCEEQKAQRLLIYANPGLEAKDVGKPELWQTLQHNLVPFSTGWVIADDESWAVEFLVRSNIPGRCSVVVLRAVELPAFDHSAKRTLPEGISVVYGSAAEGWIAARTNADGSKTIMGKGINHPEWQTEEDVIRWVLDHASVRQPPTGVRRFAS